MRVIQWFTFTFGVMLFSLGITIAINVQHLGIHPWDVLNVALFDLVGLSIGSWAIIISFSLIVVSWILDKSYIKLGTFLNAFMVGLFVDFYMWLDFLPKATYTWIDILIILMGIVIMGIGGGVYNAAGVGSGPRDGFMLSISDKLKSPIRRIRIISETMVLVIGLLLGGPVFIFSLIFTFVQSPVFQLCYLKCKKYLLLIEEKMSYKNADTSSHVKKTL